MSNFNKDRRDRKDKKNKNVNNNTQNFNCNPTINVNPRISVVNHDGGSSLPISTLPNSNYPRN